MLPGALGGGVIVTAVQACVLVPQGPVASTQTLPGLEPKVTLMEVVPCPELIVAPAGTVQLYVVAPELPLVV
jgi:hypothetical protein